MRMVWRIWRALWAVDGNAAGYMLIARLEPRPKGKQRSPSNFVSELTEGILINLWFAALFATSLLPWISFFFSGTLSQDITKHINQWGVNNSIDMLNMTPAGRLGVAWSVAFHQFQRRREILRLHTRILLLVAVPVFAAYCALFIISIMGSSTGPNPSDFQTGRLIQYGATFVFVPLVAVWCYVDRMYAMVLGVMTGMLAAEGDGRSGRFAVAGLFFGQLAMYITLLFVWSYTVFTMFWVALPRPGTFDPVNDTLRQVVTYGVAYLVTFLLYLAWRQMHFTLLQKSMLKALDTTRAEWLQVLEETHDGTQDIAEPVALIENPIQPRYP
jgi:hypothetical protein